MDTQKKPKLRRVIPIDDSQMRRLEVEARRESLFLVTVAVVMIVAWLLFDLLVGR